MNHSPSSLQHKQQYAEQLVQLREGKELFLDHYFPEFGHRRAHMDKLLTSYASVLDLVLDHGVDACRDLVLIGSHVTVTYMEDGITDTYTLVFPEEADPERSRISFFSPIGEQLLMRVPGDLLTMETNMGLLHIRIDGVKPETD